MEMNEKNNVVLRWQDEKNAGFLHGNYRFSCSLTVVGEADANQRLAIKHFPDLPWVREAEIEKKGFASPKWQTQMIAASDQAQARKVAAATLAAEKRAGDENPLARNSIFRSEEED